MVVKRLIDSRELRDIKQKDVAEELNVHFSSYSAWESGKDTIPIRRLIDYANKYKFSLDYLFGISNSNNYVPLSKDPVLIGKRLRSIRKKHKKTQQEIADILNTSQSAYAHYENGINLITTSFLFNLSLIYKDISFDKIFSKK